MSDTSKFKTAHQIARELLAGPDLIVTLPVPTFDTPGQFVAFPARVDRITVDGMLTVALLPDADALQFEATESEQAVHGTV